MMSFLAASERSREYRSRSATEARRGFTAEGAEKNKRRVKLRVL
jgi:hypothetical protein